MDPLSQSNRKVSELRVLGGCGRSERQDLDYHGAIRVYDMDLHFILGEKLIAYLLGGLAHEC